MPLASLRGRDARRRPRARGYIDRDRLRSGFSHLVISDALLEQLGPAVNAGKAVFLYGPPGNGKTVIAEGMGRALGGDMYVPHAIDVDGQIITIFDPINHETLERHEAATSASSADAPRDRRWVRIRRPVVMVGGELTLDMLDLTFNPLSKFYEAPLQMKANGGVFLVDDFGRQRMRPQDLLNRWIVPLESRVDYLTLHTGKKFQVPFDVLIVFATNLDPQSLVDEAFLRRIPYKIPIEDPDARRSSPRIFELNCRGARLVPPGDGVVPAAPALPRRSAAAARVSAARPARTGDRAVPLPRHRAGDHAGATRRGLHVLFRRFPYAAGGYYYASDERPDAETDRRRRRSGGHARGAPARPPRARGPGGERRVDARAVLGRPYGVHAVPH